MSISSEFRVGLQRLAGPGGSARGSRSKSAVYECWHVYAGNLQSLRSVTCASDPTEVVMTNSANESRIANERLARMVDIIDQNRFASTAYRKGAIASPIVKELYQSGKYRAAYMDINGQPTMREIEGFPCHYCGRIPPLTIMEIDYQRPKSTSSGGRVAAVTKVLRHQNMTEEGGKGKKTIHGIKILAAPHGAKTVKQGLYPKGLPTSSGHVVGVWDQSKEGRYTTTEISNALLSVMKAMNLDERFEDACVNSNLNLLPARPAFNKKRSDDRDAL